MNNELEIKVLKIDIEKIKNEALNKGAILIEKVEQENIVYDSKYPIIPDRSYLRTRKEKNLIKGTVEYQLTYKKNIDNNHLRENEEFTILYDDHISMVQILKNLSFEVIHQGTKYRESYAYKGARLDFDTWDKDTYPEPILEIEVESNEMLQEIIQSLNLPEKNLTTKSIAELKDELSNNIK